MANSTMTPNVTKPEWTQAADSAKEAAVSVGGMASHAASAVGGMASQAVNSVSKKADDLTASAGAGIHSLGDQLSANTPHEGAMGGISQAVAKSVREGGEYLERAKFSGMTESIAHVIRQHPIPSLLIGIGLGWLVAHKLRS